MLLRLLGRPTVALLLALPLLGACSSEQSDDDCSSASETSYAPIRGVEMSEAYGLADCD